MIIFYLKKLMLKGKIKKMRQQIKENVKLRKLFKLVTRDMRSKISYMKKQ
jgi:hypothetical protein